MAGGHRPPSRVPAASAPVVARRRGTRTDSGRFRRRAGDPLARGHREWGPWPHDRRTGLGLRPWTDGGAPPTTSRSPDLPDGQPAAAQSRCVPSTSSHGCWGTGNDAGAQLRLRPPQPGDRGARAADDLRDRPRPRRAGRGRRPYLGGTYSEIYPEIGLDEAGLRRLFTQFSFPGGIPSHAAPGRRARSTGRRGSATPCRTRTAPPSTTPTSWSLRWSVTARNRDRPAGDQLALDEVRRPRRDGAVLPILHLNGYRSQTRPCSPGSPRTSWSASCAATGTRRTSSRLRPGADAPTSPAPWTAASGGSPTSRARARSSAGAVPRRPWPMIVLRSPKAGPDRRRSTGSAWRGLALHQCRSPTRAPTMGTGRCSGMDAQLLTPSPLFDESGAPAPDIAALARRRAADERVPATAACC